ncbi:unnamed protein product [Protopolystoma xenopodis]|uniref:EGF-like domain-containing protein n=1 Tax=Protopolystoma xenopodis TaxID=117903 RepID=A0A448WSG0_9PLAT|nr:unnamed protein product [Protopolystoma xenopodis]
MYALVLAGCLHAVYINGRQINFARLKGAPVTGSSRAEKTSNLTSGSRYGTAIGVLPGCRQSNALESLFSTGNIDLAGSDSGQMRLRKRPTRRQTPRQMTVGYSPTGMDEETEVSGPWEEEAQSMVDDRHARMGLRQVRWKTQGRDGGEELRQEGKRVGHWSEGGESESTLVPTSSSLQLSWKSRRRHGTPASSDGLGPQQRDSDLLINTNCMHNSSGCLNAGMCRRSANGIEHCQCIGGYAGVRCEQRKY